MPGWNLKKGDLSQEKTSDDDYWKLFNSFFAEINNKISTYKFSFLKAIFKNTSNAIQIDDGFFLSYSFIFTSFIENYWDLVIKLHLKQMRQYKVERMTRIEAILLSYMDKAPSKYELEFSFIPNKERDGLISRVKRECSNNVIGALYGDFQGKLYSFDLDKKGIVLSKSAFTFIEKNKSTLSAFNDLAWARFMVLANPDVDISVFEDYYKKRTINHAIEADGNKTVKIKQDKILIDYFFNVMKTRVET